MQKVIFMLLSVTMILALFSGCNTASNEDSRYTKYRDITAEERDMFDKVIAGSDTTMTYEPLQVATQVVDETNYRFKATADDNGTKYKAYIEIYKPLHGDPQLQSIDSIGKAKLFFESWFAGS